MLDKSAEVAKVPIIIIILFLRKKILIKNLKNFLILLCH